MKYILNENHGLRKQEDDVKELKVIFIIKKYI